jgi:N6-adenosine-specific RNA methylase IME4
MRCLECNKKLPKETRSDATTCSTRCRVARHRRIRAATPPWPGGKFDLVIIDNPLDWKGYSRKGEGRSPQAHYETLDVAALVHLLNPLLAACMEKDSIAAWWVYGPRLPDTLRVIEACGYKYTTELLVWEKPGIGTGLTTRKNCESLWGSKRGRGLPIRDHGVRQKIEAPRGRHSAKPAEAYEALERLYGDVRRLDIFARQPRPGWVPWGNQVEATPGLQAWAAE